METFEKYLKAACFQCIHYGSNNYDPKKFKFISNNGICVNKPSGGLWSSPVSTEWGWYQWCQAEEFRLECLNKKFYFNISSMAKICVIDTYNDFIKLPVLEIEEVSNFYITNWEEVLTEYDAVHLTINGEQETRFPMSSKRLDLYGWDCETVLILNPEIIIPI